MNLLSWNKEALLKHLAIVGLSGFSKIPTFLHLLLGGRGIIGRIFDENSNNLAIAVSLIFIISTGSASLA